VPTDMTEIEGCRVPKWPTYQDDPTHRARECAVYVCHGDRYQYLTRGPVDEVLPALTHRAGWLGGLSAYSPDVLRVTLDAPSHESYRDQCYLMWCGPRLTLAQFRAWLASSECPTCEGEGTSDGFTECADCGGRGRMGTP